MTDTTDVCVVGGGLLGVAAAYYASRRGARVVLLEAQDLASGASGAAFGGLSASIYSYVETRVPAHYVDLSLASLELYRDLEEELGPPLDLEWKPSLDPFHDEDAWDLVSQRVENLQAYGVPVTLVGQDELAELEPSLSPDVAGASYCSIDGHVTPLNVVWALADGARRHGADLRTGVRVEEVLTSGERVIGVRTSNGEIFHAEWTVVTAGIGTSELTSTAGIDVPISFSRGQLFVTERVPPLLRTFLHTIKQTRSGTVVIGATKEADIGITSTTMSGTREMMIEAVRLIPALKRIRLLRAWAGIRPVPADGYPILGPVDGLEGMLVAVMHRGVTLAPVIGEILSDLIVDGRTDHDIDPYRLSRFHEKPGVGQERSR